VVAVADDASGRASWLRGQRVLVVTPHADDETLGCAGTIARVKQLGGEVYCRVASLGGIRQYTREPTAAGAPADAMRFVAGATRRAEFDAVMELLSVDGWDVLFDDSRHMALDLLPVKDLVAALERGGDLSFAVLQPTLVLIPARTFNQDHDALFRACLAATRPPIPVTSRYVPPNVLAYDNGTAFWSGGGEPFHPTVYVDISDVLDLKAKAAALYASQAGAPDSAEDDCVTTARSYGHRIGREAAEAFQVLRMTA
jgi:LmbE family N-acetylglucosaminyl deacetylase